MTHSAIQYELDAAPAEMVGSIACNLPIKGTENVVMSVYELHRSFSLCRRNLCQIYCIENKQHASVESMQAF